MGSFYTLARLYEPSAYRSLLDALLITPVAKPPLQASAPSRKSTSALELPKSKRYCPGVVCGWHLGLTGNHYSFKAHFCCLHACACPGLWPEVTSSKPCWFHLFTQLMCTLDLLMVFVQVHHTKPEVSSPLWLQVPSNMHGGACVVSWASEGGSVTLQRQLEKKQGFWLETSVWLNYLPQFLEQLNITSGYFLKLTLNV